MRIELIQDPQSPKRTAEEFAGELWSQVNAKIAAGEEWGKDPTLFPPALEFNITFLLAARSIFSPEDIKWGMEVPWDPELNERYVTDECRYMAAEYVDELVESGQSCFPYDNPVLDPYRDTFMRWPRISERCIIIEEARRSWEE